MAGQNNGDAKFKRRNSVAPVDEMDTEHIDLHISILPSQYWNENLNCAPYQSLAEAITVGFLRCHILSSIVALREEIDQQLSDSKNLPSQYIFLKGVGRALVAIRPRQEHMLTVENFKHVGSRIPPEICILEMNATRKNNLMNGGSNSFNSQNSNNNGNNLSGSLDSNNQRLLNKRGKNTVFDNSPEESAQDLRNRVNKGVQDRLQGHRGSLGQNQRSQSQDRAGSQSQNLTQKGNNQNNANLNNSNNNNNSTQPNTTNGPKSTQNSPTNKKTRAPSNASRKSSLNNSMSDSPRRSKTNSVRFPPVEQNVVEYDSDIVPRHYPIDGDGNRVQQRTNIVNSNAQSIGSDYSGGQQRISKNQNIQRRTSLGQSSTPINRRSSEELSSQNNTPRDRGKQGSQHGNALSNVKNMASKKKNTRRNSMSFNRENSNERDSTDIDTDYTYETFTHDTTISSIENYNPNGQRAGRKSNRPSKANKSLSNKADTTITKEKKRKDSKVQYNEVSASDMQELHETQSHDEFYKKRASLAGEEVLDIGELKNCPECGLTFKTEPDKKRHFNLIHRQSAQQIKARQKLLKNKKGKAANRPSRWGNENIMQMKN